MAEVTGCIVSKKMQEASREWERRIAYGAHLISEWAVRHFAYLGYQPKDMPHTNLQLLPQWQMPSESSQENAQEDEGDNGHHVPS